jgi:hypothetical protein
MDQPSFAHDALPGGVDDFLLEEEIQRDRELLAVEVPLMRERRLKHLERRAQRAAAEPERPRRPPPRSSGYYIALLASGMPKSERLRQAAATVRAVVADDGAPLPVPVTVAGAERAAPPAPSAATAAKVAAATVPPPPPGSGVTPPEPLSTYLTQLPFLPPVPQLRDQAVKLAEAQAERRAALEQFRAGLLADEAKARRLEAARRAADRPATIATPKAEPVANGAVIAAANAAAIAKPAEAPEPKAPPALDEAKLRQQVQEFQARRGRPGLDQDPRVQELLTRVERKRRPVPIEATPTPRRRR